jgi:hypothetical protein
MTFRPDFRDFIILTIGDKKKDTTNDFESVFAPSIRFLRSCELCDVWIKNSHTGLYSFSGAFYECFHDVRCWAMSSDFFEIFPQFIGYIPIYNPGPGNIFGGVLPLEQYEEICLELAQGTQDNSISCDLTGSLVIDYERHHSPSFF